MINLKYHFNSGIHKMRFRLHFFCINTLFKAISDCADHCMLFALQQCVDFWHFSPGSILMFPKPGRLGPLRSENLDVLSVCWRFARQSPQSAELHCEYRPSDDCEKHQQLNAQQLKAATAKDTIGHLVGQYSAPLQMCTPSRPQAHYRCIIHHPSHK